MTAPVSMVGGWYDFFLPLQLRDYAALRAGGHEPYLTIGPWRHADQAGDGDLGLASPWPGCGRICSATAAACGPSRSGSSSPARRNGASCPGGRRPPTPQRWHLQPDGALAPGLPAAGEPDRYRYDPADPTPNLGGPIGYTGRARVDNRILEARPDVLTYTSAPLDRGPLGDG